MTRLLLLGTICLVSIWGCLPLSGANLVANGDFERGATGWNLKDGVVDGREVRQGSGALRLEGSGATLTTRSDRFKLLPNRLYRLQTAARTLVPAEIRVLQMDQTGANLDSAGMTGILPETDWQTVTNVFWTLPATAQGLVMLMRREDGGPAHFDDVSVELLPEVAPWRPGSGEAVDFPGQPSLQGMSLSAGEVSGNELTVTTTGAEFVLNTEARTLVAMQTEGQRRPRATAKLPGRLGPPRVVKQDADRVIVVAGDLELGFHGDSMVFFAGKPGTKVTVERSFEPQFSGWREGFLTAIDDIGGLALYPSYQRGTGVAESVRYTTSGPRTSPSAVTYELRAGGRVALAVFPPRPFDWQKSFEWQLIHSAGFPTKAVLEDWSRLGNVLVLHENIWQGRAPKVYFDYLPTNESALRRVIRDARAAGLKVLPYFSSDFFADQVGDQFIATIKRLRDDYGFDGVYYDQLPGNYWERGYTIMRQTRELFPTGPIYLHNTPAAPFGRDYTAVFLPQVDAYADFVLKGEAIPINGWADPYLRFVARGYGVSNTIGTLKYDKMVVGGAEPSLAEALEGLLTLNMRQRIMAYPNRGGYPSTASMAPEWPDYRAQLGALRQRFEAGEVK